MRLHWSLALGLLLAACTSNGSQGVSYTPDDYQLALNAVNQARSQPQTCGSSSYPAAPALRWNGLLGEVARQRAEYIQQTNDFRHEEGSSTEMAAAVRARANGYEYREIRENLYRGPGSAAEAVTEWLGSPSHCQTLMAPHLREMGMVKRGAYWVLVVAQPR
ncbi:CAP domain-containing protein [Meiothermus taiwanensis]|jgi:uncharacterized protein YkwD|uniref:Uncharacterized protein, YkwD family n=2 Tax=Meiothermus taiwanensis TaxID=172827 RepID=A0A399E8G4_9DEIN|nr:CAP domain-containing protein [Meiothermus taiwanensis]AWR86619.1 hypothetical protein Mtai_v1c13770 [Meiothermus taiwanensis WR-220]KIQ55577.1 hypothetical protein SY28_02600 [Meiothermus taiwanensis]KZK15982.1 hypothetical protein A3962_00695 [Meiothermus taiwanensis]RIH78581.1 uncharacterized protein, YkwD family [Meiothermus taiwanensis]